MKGSIRAVGMMVVALLVWSLGASACHSSTPVTEPTPTVSVTESFSGTLLVNGATTYPFTVSAAGAVTATLSALTPEIEDTPIAISIALGTWNGTTSTCTLIVTNDKAVKNSIVGGTATGATSLCLRVSDVGNVANVPEPVMYTVDVVHY